MDDTDRLLLRTNLTLSFDKLLRNIQANYPAIGRILSYQPLKEGYENANFKLKCTNGQFVVKIYSKLFSEANIHDNILVHSTIAKAGVPVAQLISGENGPLLLAEDLGEKKVYLAVMSFFEGESLDHPGLRMEDIKAATGFLRKINSIKLEITPNYDEWGVLNLENEFAKKNRSINNSYSPLIKQALHDFKKIELDRMPKSLIHGDLQRKHILKNQKKEYLVIDFGCANYAARVVDLAIFLATFCFDEKMWSQRSDIFEELRYGYLEPLRYTDREIEAIPTLVKTTYAIYLLNASYLQEKQGDTSEQTSAWLDLSHTMLKLLQDWHIVF